MKGFVNMNFTTPDQVPPFYIDTYTTLTYPPVEPNRYYIYTDGRIYDTQTNRFLPVHFAGGDYPKVTLHTDYGAYRAFFIHRLVAYEFCTRPDDIHGYTVNHIDGNKANNINVYLEWATYEENNAHSRAMGLAAPPPRQNSRITEEEARVIFKTMEENPDKTVKEIKELLGTNLSVGYLNSIRSSNTFSDIREEYNINRLEKPNKIKLSEEDTRKICEQLENKGIKSFRRIVELAGLEDTKRNIYAARMINKGKLNTDISDEYNFDRMPDDAKIEKEKRLANKK